jgi:hypothetical protein
VSLDFCVPPTSPNNACISVDAYCHGERRSSTSFTIQSINQMIRTHVHIQCHVCTYHCIYAWVHTRVHQKRYVDAYDQASPIDGAIYFKQLKLPIAYPWRPCSETASLAAMSSRSISAAPLPTERLPLAELSTMFCLGRFHTGTLRHIR